jgi:hypothetical protein
VAKVRMHVAICFACIYVITIVVHRIGRPELANCIAAFTYWNPKKASFMK